MGSDVVANASSYKKLPSENSIHSLNHVVFKRDSLEQGGSGEGKKYHDAKALIKGDLVELTLPTYLEDISSTRIRENIDNNRDISSLIDPVAQKYIYDYSLYLREPQYKKIIAVEELSFNNYKEKGNRYTKIYENKINKKILASVLSKEADPMNLYKEFMNKEIADFIRSNSSGKTLVINSVTLEESIDKDEYCQLAITEVLSEGLKDNFTYAVYNPSDDYDKKYILDVLFRQGFVEVVIDGTPTGKYVVNMKHPITLIQNMGSVIKAPFNNNKKVIYTLDNAHKNLQTSLTKLYEGNLVLSFSSNVMHHKLIEKITKANGVPKRHLKRRRLGPYMCVPYGKMLNNIAIPNTVTKTLHMEKSFFPDIKSFEIREYPFYASIENQIRTIKSFDKPVILVDDLLHKGYRIKRLKSVLKKDSIEIKKVLVGILSGQGKDLMSIENDVVDSVYFIPNLKSWFVESSQYPFIGGDGVIRNTGSIDDALIAINMIMPYVSPPFLFDVDKEKVFNLSLTCLKNARDIFRVIEEEYQNIYKKKLTLRRLSEAINSPKIPDVGECLYYDRSMSASVYIESDIERLLRIKGMI